MAERLVQAFVTVCVCLLVHPSLSYYDPEFELYKEMLELDGLRDQYVDSSSEDFLGDYPQNYVFNVDLLMPNITPQHANDYKCYSVPTPEDTSVFIVGFEAQSLKKAAHHILLFGCEEPGSDEETWDCGEMNTDGKGQSTPCAGWPRILYAWAMNAPPLDLPKDVGFEIGGATRIRHLVLQIHYASVTPFEDGSTDNSGLTLKVTDAPQRYKAGTYFMGADGKIPAKSKVHLETACSYDEEPRLFPFAFRVHAHSLGEVISGYRIQEGEEWTEIGKQDPQLPQMFYPIEEKGLVIQAGDVLAARCTMNNYKDKTVMIGPTMSDEMCNFYMMYFTDSPHLPENDICFNGAGFKWKDYFENIPDKEASELPAKQEETDEKPTEMKMDSMEKDES